MENNLSQKEKILIVKNINKEFPGVKALTNFSFELYKGEVHCLIGENGAGKSTFIKILSGAISPSSGEICINQNKYDFITPQIARKLGIKTVYQDENLIPSLSVAENIFFGSEMDSQKLFVNHNKLLEMGRNIAKKFGIDINITEIYEKLNPSDQQFVKILKAFSQEPKILVLDEPTQAFNVNDINLIIQLVKKISRQGVSVIYIAHNLDEIIRVADRITVLRDGFNVITHDRNDDVLSTDNLAKEMIGRPVDLFYKKKQSEIGDFVFEVQNLKLKETSKGINFKVKKGEILGIAGLKGAGSSEIIRAIFGASKKYDGKIFYQGKNITPSNPVEGVKSGLSLVTEDKQLDGLFMGMPVNHNITIVGLDKIGKFFINSPKENKVAIDYIKKLNINTPSVEKDVRFLSGGNQQKVVLAKWLFTGVNILIVDEPTHGIDVNAKTEVYELFSLIAASGTSIIMVSSEMPELISISDRVIVIKNYEISRELVGSEITEENILAGFLGGNKVVR